MICALALTGCGSGPSPSGGGGSGYASFAWYIFDIEDTAYATALTCAEVGAATVVVTLTNQATGAVYTQNPANCVDGQASTASVPVGGYYVGIDLYGDPTIYGNSTTLLDSFDLADSSGTALVYPIGAGLNDFRAGYAASIVQSFTVGWSFASGSALSVCGVVGTPYVDLVFPVAGSTTGVTSPFNCTAGQGTSYAIPYTSASPLQWQLFLVSSAGTDLQELNGSAPLPPNSNVNLGTQLFSY
jgi:hypothetical protein